MTRDPEINREFLRRILRYDPKTGAFTWLVDRTGKTRAGDTAGGFAKNGYHYISVRGRKYQASHLAWVYITDRWPTPFEMDHINGNPSDNRFNNLRRATRSKNMANTRWFNPSGYKGASPTKEGRWRAQITKNYKNHHLGAFDTPQEAHAAYVKASRELFGSFARHQ